LKPIVDKASALILWNTLAAAASISAGVRTWQCADNVVRCQPSLRHLFALSARSLTANAPAELSEITMFNESKCVSLMYEQGLDQWTRACYHEAVEAKFINPTYYPDPATIRRLRGYFGAGLSPIEAAQACFGHRH
jgi:hypothetical protein